MPHSFDRLEPGLAICGSPRNAADLNVLDFSGILNVADFAPPNYARGLRPDIEFVRRPINDVYPVPLPYLRLAVLELADLRRRGRNTLLHCQAGRSRSPTVAALFWMARDGMSWTEAVARLCALRPSVEPNPFFAAEPSRAAILAPVRALLAGDATVLADARERREALIATFRSRAPELAEPGSGWNLIEANIALGGAGADAAELAGHGFVVLPAELGPAPDLNDPRLVALVRQMAGMAASGRPFCLVSPGDELPGMLGMVGYFILERGWDAATACWYVGARRSALWQHVKLLWSADWAALRGGYAAG